MVRVLQAGTVDVPAERKKLPAATATIFPISFVAPAASKSPVVAELGRMSVLQTGTVATPAERIYLPAATAAIFPIWFVTGDASISPTVAAFGSDRVLHPTSVPSERRKVPDVTLIARSSHVGVTPVPTIKSPRVTVDAVVSVCVALRSALVCVAGAWNELTAPTPLLVRINPAVLWSNPVIVLLALAWRTRPTKTEFGSTTVDHSGAVDAPAPRRYRPAAPADSRDQTLVADP